MAKNPIPTARAGDVLHMYWILLGSLESRVDGDPMAGLDRAAVTSGYNILNDIGYTDARPAWEARAKKGQS